MRKKWIERGFHLVKEPFVIIASLNVATALLAFLKDVGIAMTMGTSKYADAFQLAYFVPDTLGTNILAAAFGTVCIPFLAKLNEQAELQAHVAKQAMKMTLAISMLLCLVLYLCLPTVTTWLGGEGTELTLLLESPLKIMLPVLVLFSLAMVGSGIHQAQFRFYVPLAAPLMVNGMIVIGIALTYFFPFHVRHSLTMLSWSYVMGTALMTFMIWAPLGKWLKSTRQRVKSTMNAVHKPKTASVTALINLFILYTAILLCIQLILFVERYLAARDGEGAVAALSLAYRVTQLPIWVFVAAFGTLILPRIAKYIASSDHQSVQQALYQAIHFIFLLSLPATCLLWLLSEPITSLLFKRGAFTAQSVQMTAEVLGSYSFSIVFQAMIFIILRFLLADNRLYGAVVVCFISTVLWVVIDGWFMRKYGLLGLGYGAALGSCVQAAGLMLLLRTYRIRTMFMEFVKILLVNVMITIGLFLGFGKEISGMNAILAVLIYLLLYGIYVYRTKMECFQIK